MQQSSVERRKLQRCMSCYIKSSINLLFAEGNALDVAPAMQCLSEKNLKHFAGSRLGSSGPYKRMLAAGKEELNFEDLQESCNNY